MRVLVIFSYFIFKKTKFLTYIPRTVEKRSRNGEHCNKGDVNTMMEGEDRAVLEEEESVGTQGESLVDGVG